MNFIKVEKEEIPVLAALASDIWHEYWGIILSDEQIEYMVENFQSEKAMKKQISEENYSYCFINDNGENIGYFGISPKDGYMFLSKLYIKKNSAGREQGAKLLKKLNA